MLHKCCGRDVPVLYVIAVIDCFIHDRESRDKTSKAFHPTAFEVTRRPPLKKCLPLSEQHVGGKVQARAATAVSFSKCAPAPSARRRRSVKEQKIEKGTNQPSAISDMCNRRSPTTCISL
jgi:hypothetical protein